jgi:hypothetical protein
MRLATLDGIPQYLFFCTTNTTKYSLRNFMVSKLETMLFRHTECQVLHAHETKGTVRPVLYYIYMRTQRGNILNSAISRSTLAKFYTRGKIKGKGHPRTGHVGPEGKYRYSYTPSLTSTLDGGRWSTPCPGRFTPRKETWYPL